MIINKSSGRPPKAGKLDRQNYLKTGVNTLDTKISVSYTSAKEFSSFLDIGKDNILASLVSQVTNKIGTIKAIDYQFFNVSIDISNFDIFSHFVKAMKISNDNYITYGPNFSRFVVYNDAGLVFVAIINKHPYKTIHIDYEFNSFEAFQSNKVAVNKYFKDFIVQDTVFADIEWWYANKNGSASDNILEELDDIVYPEAYPYINDFDGFITNFINSSSQILILMGTPGTGKTRLIRHIIKQIISEENIGKKYEQTSDFESDTYNRFDNINKAPSILYTISSKVLNDDAFFIQFLSGEHKAIVLEDIDFDLRARSDGNETMYKILAGSDGFIRNNGKKIIISTNIDNIKNMDDALIRPGRCYGVVQTRALKDKEITNFVEKINPGFDINNIYNVPMTLAEIYKLVNESDTYNTFKVKKVGF